MKFKVIARLGIFVLSILLLAGAVNLVQAAGQNPAEGWWEIDWWDWDRGDTASFVPQFQLAPTVQEDYALLQTDGVTISGPAKLCHSYPGIRLGWHPEFRMQTATGWVPLATTYEWVHDEEGYFLACTQAWWRGTYALFGYWEKPEPKATPLFDPGPRPYLQALPLPQ